MRQVITITPTGGVEGLQVKPGKGVDLTKFGTAEVKRASEIVWDADEQAWKVDVLQDAGKGVITVAALAIARLEREAVDTLAPSIRHDLSPAFESPVFFDSYDDAVKVEIAYLDALRLKGMH